MGAALNRAGQQGDLQAAVIEAYRIDSAKVNSVGGSFFDTVRLWLSGSRFREMAEHANLTIDEMLGIHAQVLPFVLQTIVEQGIALLAKFVESQGRTLSSAVTQLPDYLRFGVPTAPARSSAAGGVRHRSAAVALRRGADRGGYRFRRPDGSVFGREAVSADISGRLDCSSRCSRYH